MKNHDLTPQPQASQPERNAKHQYAQLDTPISVSVKRGNTENPASGGSKVDDDWFAAGVVTTSEGEELIHVYRLDGEGDEAVYLQKLVPAKEHHALQNERMRDALRRSMGNETVHAAGVLAAAEPDDPLNAWGYDPTGLTDSKRLEKVVAAAVRPPAEDPLTIARRQNDMNHATNQAYLRSKSGHN